MGSRISPENNSVLLLLKPQPIADKIPLISTAVDVPEVGPKKIPVNFVKTGSKPSGDSTEVVGKTPAPVVTSNGAAEMVIGYRAGGGIMKSVIPKRRRLVKTMIYHAIKDFVTSLFCRPPAGA